jgi:hypothetical protein
MNTHKAWKQQAEAQQKQIFDEEKRIGLTKDIAELQADNAKVRVELHKLLVARPQVWSYCQAAVTPNKAKGTAAIAVNVPTFLPTGGATPPAPVPLGIHENCTLFAFEEPTAETPGRYLGEFSVTAVEPKPQLIDDNQNPQQKIQISTVKMQPAYSLSEAELKKLAEAKGTWTFYNVLPQDEHDIFAKLTDEQKQTLFPKDFSKETLAEYLGDGKPASVNAPKDRIDANGNYIRPLRNYALIFDHCRQRKTILFDEAEATTRDMKLVEESVADAKRQVQFYQNLKNDMTARLAKSEKDRDNVAKLCDNLDVKIKTIGDAVEKLIQKNKAMAGQLAEKQLEATRLIEARTRVMAQTASTGGEK